VKEENEKRMWNSPRYQAFFGGVVGGVALNILAAFLQYLFSKS